MKLASRQAGRRPGFTMIELLVVISIIAILGTLLAGAAFQVLAQQQKNNTETTLQKVSDAFDQQWKAVIDQAKKEAPQPGVLTLAGGDENRARTMWIVLRLRQEFPVSFAEATSPIQNAGLGILLPAKDAYVRAINSRTGATNPNTESAACLVLALSQGRRGMASFNLDEALGSGALRDTDNDGLKEIVDAWGTAIGFWRWPMLNPEFLSITNKVNPVDPSKVLTAPVWDSSGNSNAVLTFEALSGGYVVHDPSSNVWPRVFYSIPVVGSAGRNKQFGLSVGTMDPSPPNNTLMNDNLYSYRLRIGGKGD